MSKENILVMAFSHNSSAPYSIFLDVLFAHDATPAGQLLAQYFPEFGARGRCWDGARLQERLAHVGGFEHGDDRVVHFRHGGRRRLRRGQQPYQLSATVSGKPCSASVATSGNNGLRLAEAAPMGLSLPA